LNNPLAGLLAALFLLMWINPQIKTRFFGFLKKLTTESPHRYYFFSLLVLTQVFLVAMHLTSPAKSYWDLNIEKGYATYFSTIQMYTLGLVVFIIANAKKSDLNPIPKVYEWYLVTGLFFYLALDECIGIHDKVNVEASKYIPHWEGINSIFVWLWVFAPMIFVSIIFLIRFFFRTSKSNRQVLFVFLAGLSSWVVALILEAIARSSSFPRYLLIAMEEGLEMFGATLLILGFGIYLKNTLPKNTA
jgi:hypothetical protein